MISSLKSIKNFQRVLTNNYYISIILPRESKLFHFNPLLYFTKNSVLCGAVLCFIYLPSQIGKTFFIVFFLIFYIIQTNPCSPLYEGPLYVDTSSVNNNRVDELSQKVPLSLKWDTIPFHAPEHELHSFYVKTLVWIFYCFP